jgi:hypothetical protein
MHTLRHAALAVAALAGAACGGADGSPEAPTAVYRHFGSVQCTGGGTSLFARERELLDAGIHVAAAGCGIDGNAYPALCGAPDGRIGIFEIGAQHVALATALGFAPLRNLPAAVRLPCP